VTDAELEALDARVAAARRAPGERELEDALLTRVNARMRSGRMEEATTDLDELVELHRAAGRTREAIRCLHLSATSRRFAGDVDGAIAQARAAWEEAPQHTPLKVSAATELGESYLSRQEGALALGWFERALSQGEAIGMVAAARGALLRKQADAAAIYARYALAALNLRAAREAFDQASDAVAALECEVQEASAWVEAGEFSQAVAALRSADRKAKVRGDDRTLARLHLAWAAVSVHRGDLKAAVSFAERARSQALQAVDGITYTGAAVALSELHAKLDRRQEAYAALAVGWVTLADLVGKELAQAAFAPKLRALADAWGHEAFAEVRDAYSRRSGSH